MLAEQGIDLPVLAGEISSCHGIGPTRLTVIRALPELARRFYAASLPNGATIRNPNDTKAFLQARLRHLGHELFCCLFLDNRHRVLRFDEMFRGTIDGTSVYPREVVKAALARPPDNRRWPGYVAGESRPDLRRLSRLCVRTARNRAAKLRRSLTRLYYARIEMPTGGQAR